MTVAAIHPFGEPGLTALKQGLAAQQAGQADRAVECYRLALRQHPGLAPAHFNLGQLLRERGDYAGAAVAFEGAARLRPSAVDAWLNLGAMLERLDRHRDAVAAYQRATAAAPSDVRPLYNRGNALLALGDHAAAAVAYRAVLEVEPRHVEANWNLATALLAMGNFAAGWAHYEWRWAKRGLDPAGRFPWPMWAGEPLAGRRILVWREQGIGDELMFATCLRELVAAGAEVTFLATDRLQSLFARGFPSVRVIGSEHELPESVDCHLPIGSLPRYTRQTRESYPVSSKFLVPDSQAATNWTSRLEKLGDGPKVGLCWRSGLLADERGKGYSRLDDWGAVFALPGVHWINLQYDKCADELVAAEKRFGIKIHRWRGDDLKNDLESVVGLLWNLDGVVTAPTAVSSLAGALGVPTWEVDAGGDWTAHGEARSPWFPTIRVVARAAGSLEWDPVLARVATDLAAVLPRPVAV